MPVLRKAFSGKGRGWARRGFTRPPGLQKKDLSKEEARTRKRVWQAGRAAAGKLSAGLRQTIRQAAISAAKIAREKGISPRIAARAAAQAALKKFRETGVVP